MLKKIFLILFLLISISIVNSKENLLIVTKDSETYSSIKEILKSSGTNYYVELIKVDDTGSDFSGSESYLENNIVSPAVFGLYIDQEDATPGVYGFTSDFRPPLKILKIIIDKLDVGKKIAREFPLYMTSMLPESPLINIYREYDVPLIILKGPLSGELIDSILKTDVDKHNSKSHYYIFNTFGQIRYITEKVIFLIHLIFIFFIILIINIFSKRAKFHLKTNSRYFATIPVKIFMIFIFYFVSGLIIEYIIAKSEVDGFLLHYPRTLFTIKHLILFFIYGITFHIIKDISFSKSPHFYSHISLYLSIIIYFILCSIYLPLGLIQIWSIMITILFIGVRDIEVKRFLLFLKPIVIIIFFNIYVDKEFSYFVRLISGSGYMGNIILTFIISPYIFLSESFYRFTHRKQNKVVQAGDIILSLLTITVTITLTAIILELK